MPRSCSLYKVMWISLSPATTAVLAEQQALERALVDLGCLPYKHNPEGHTSHKRC